jgi:hypothetical protein
MRRRNGIIRAIALVFFVGLLSVALGPKARAGEWNERTQLTFTGPVEIPGKVLPAGTYTFQLMNSDSNRNIVEVFNKNRTKLYAVVMAIPDYRMTPASKTVVTFEERPSDTPEAIHAWFYPGELYGQEFVYHNSSPRGYMAMASRKSRTAAG